jgi:proteasome activator subunit 4
MRATCLHDYKNYLLEDHFLPQKISVPTSRDDPNWTKSFLDTFSQPEAEYFVDHDYPGWLVWGKEFPAYKVNPEQGVQYDEVEMNARRTIGSFLDRNWFRVFFGFLKQEPRESNADRFRMAGAMLLQFAFNLLRDELTPATFQEIKEEILLVLGDASDKHQHRATAEILGAMVISYRDSNKKDSDAVWEFVLPIVEQIFEDGLTPENSSYWASYLHLILVCCLLSTALRNSNFNLRRGKIREGHGRS